MAGHSGSLLSLGEIESEILPAPASYRADGFGTAIGGPRTAAGMGILGLLDYLFAQPKATTVSAYWGHEMGPSLICLCSSAAKPRLRSAAAVAAPVAQKQRKEAMAIGKNKRLSKGKKGGKKKAVDPFTRKEWYNVMAPSVFTNRLAGKTLVNRTAGTKIASEALKGRVFEANLADLNKDEDHAYRKIRLVCEDVQGDNVLTNFHGMDMTRDKLCSLIKKWQSLVEARCDVRTTDGYILRLFCIGFTKKVDNQIKKACYAKSAQLKAIRRKMVDIMTEEASSCDLRELVLKL